MARELTEALAAGTRGFFERSPKMLIGGELVAAADGATFKTYDPATGCVLAEVPAAGAEDVDRAVRAARRALEGEWGALPPRRKGEIIWALGDIAEAHKQELAELDVLDNGKPLSVALEDVDAVVEHFHYMAGWATKVTGETIPMSVPGDFLTYTEREPVGVVGQIIPWNFPIVSIAWKIAPALAAGCAVVIKPAEQTPLSALRFAELAKDSGLPPGALNVVTGVGSVTGAAIVEHPGVDKISFTGSTATGKRIQTAAARTMKRLGLELGGKSPVIVLPDADIDLAIEQAAHAIFYNQGQVCTAGSKLIVHPDVFHQVVEGVAEIAEGLRVGPGLQATTDIGPLVSGQQLQTVSDYVESGRESGGSVITGGRRLGEEGFFYAPTVVVEPERRSRIVKEEIFGPVLVAQRLDDTAFEEIVRQANDSEFGLAASIFTRDLGMAARLARRIKAGTVWINTHHVHDSAAPFGGFKQSGYGRELGEAALHAYTELKTIKIAL
ncbi:aldehyde dehydrogenase family protein [Leucobacter sp. GX24907]